MPMGPVLEAEYETVPWVDVDSTNLQAVGYVAGLRLWVRFKGTPGKRRGTVYAYDAVPERVYLELLNAPSKGEYLHENVKGRYGYAGPY